MMKRLLALLLAVLMVTVSLSALAEDAAEEPTLLVTVNGEEIYDDDANLQYYLNYYSYYFSMYGYDLSDPDLQAYLQGLAMQQIIAITLMHQKGVEMGLDAISEEERATLEQEWADVVADYEASNYGITEDSTEEERIAARGDALADLESMGYTEEIYIDQSITYLILDRVQEALIEGITVPDEEVIEYFNDLVAEDQNTYENDVSQYEFDTMYYGQDSYYIPEGYRGVIHILLDVDDELLTAWQDLAARLEEQEEAAASEETAEEGAEASEEAEEAQEPVTQEMVDAAKQAILDSVQATVDEIMEKYNNGTSFEDLIAEYGTDPGMQDPDTLATGYMIHPDTIMYIPEFVENAIALEKVGDVSAPFLSQYGVHIMQYLRDVPGGAVELTDTMMEELRDVLLTSYQNDAINAAVDEWMDAADIVYTEAGEAWHYEDPTVDEEAEEEATEAAE